MKNQTLPEPATPLGPPTNCARLDADDNFADRDSLFGEELIHLAIPLRRYARALTGSGSDADDLFQDTMLRCWSARNRFCIGTNLIAWTRTVMRNAFFSSRRHARFQVEISEENLARLLIVQENQSHSVELRDVDWALTKIAAKQRQAVLMASRGVTALDASQQLAISQGTFKSRVSRGRLRLQRLIDDLDAVPRPALGSLTGGRRKRRSWKGLMIG